MGWWTIAIAAYAAIVATGALALEVKRWFESGPRLSIDVMAEAKTFNIPGTEGDTFVAATVSNRGNAPTTITHFALYDYRSRLGSLRRTPHWAALVASGHHTPIPAALPPGEVWHGVARHNDELKQRIKAGWLYVVICASHSDKPVMKRICPPTTPPENAERI
jgi:hypothetical protein